MGLLKFKKKSTNQTVQQPKTPTEEELFEKKIRETPDDELMVYLSTLDKEWVNYALYRIPSFFYRLTGRRFKENLEKVPEEFAYQMVTHYLITYCCKKHYENRLGNFLEDKVKRFAPGLKDIWDYTKHEKVKQLLGQFLCIYYPEVAEYMTVNRLKATVRENDYGLERWEPEKAENMDSTKI